MDDVETFQMSGKIPDVPPHYENRTHDIPQNKKESTDVPPHHENRTHEMQKITEEEYREMRKNITDTEPHELHELHASHSAEHEMPGATSHRAELIRKNFTVSRSI